MLASAAASGSTRLKWRPTHAPSTSWTTQRTRSEKKPPTLPGRLASAAAARRRRARARAGARHRRRRLDPLLALRLRQPPHVARHAQHVEHVAAHEAAARHRREGSAARLRPR